jgi:translation elongation factor EF-Tu-like GTPase
VPENILATSVLLKFIFCLFVSEYQPNGQAPISSTDKQIPSQKQHDGTVEEYSQPRMLVTDEVADVVNDFRLAARNAMEAGNLLNSKTIAQTII